MKESFYERAKALFDDEIEQDKVVLAQSAILLSHWYGNGDNIAVCWHWIGTACSLCLEMGFHREPAPSQVPEPQRRLWRRVWWCCYHRDRWIALGLGRPMRINHNDCDVADLTLADLDESTISFIGLSSTSMAIIKNFPPVAPLFLQTVSLSVCLGEIMACHFSPRRKIVSIAQSAECETDLAKWYMGSEIMLEMNYSPSFNGESTHWMLLKHILNIFYQ